MSRNRLAGLILSLLCVWGCGGKEESAPTPPVPPPAAPVAPPVPEPPPVTPATGDADNEMMPPQPIATKAEEAPGSDLPKSDEPVPQPPPRQADPKLVKRVQEAAALAGPADVVHAMKKIGAALNQYAEAHAQHFPTVDGPGVPAAALGQNNAASSSSTEPQSQNGLSWRVAILPQLGLENLYREFHLDEAWDSEHNKELVSKMPSVYGTNPLGRTRLHLITGPGTPFQPGQAPLLSDFTDGLSNTLTVVEAGPDREEEWTKPGGLPFDPEQPASSLGHVDGSFLALTANGELHRIPVDSELLANLIQYQDRGIIPPQFLKETLKLSLVESPVMTSAELPPPVPVPETFDPKFIPQDATAVVIISPRRILESQLAQSILKQFAMPDEIPAQTLDRLSKQGAGSPIPALAVEEIRIIPDSGNSPIQSGPPEASTKGGLPPGIAGLYLRTAIEIPVESLIQEAAQEADKVEVEVLDGIPHVWMRGLNHALAFPTDHEVILASNAAIRKMTAPRKAEQEPQGLIESVQAMRGPMIILAASAPQNGKLGFMQRLMAAAGPVALIAPQLGDTNLVRMSLDLEAAELLQVSLGFPQEETAKTFLEVARNLLAQGIAQGKQYQAALKQDDPAQQAQSVLLSDVMNGTEVISDGSLVSLVIRQPPHLEEIVTAFGKQIESVQLKMTSVESLPPLERISRALVAYSDKHGHLPASNGMGELEESKSKSSGPDTRPASSSGPARGSEFNPPPPGSAPTGATSQKSTADESVDPAIARNRGLSWRVYLLPFLGEQGLYEQFHLNERWDTPHNKSLVAQMPAVFGENSEGKTRFHMVVGNETLFKSGKSPDVDSLRDDPAQTIVVIETGEDKADFWTKPGGLPFDPKNPLRCLGKPDEGQKNYRTIMLDWSIQSIPVEISADEFQGLVQPSDGKPSRKAN